MILILAGADGTGKSTVFNMLQSMLGGTSFIREPYPGKSKEFRMVRREILDLFVQNNEHVSVIYDRATLLDDLIYQSVIEHTSSVFEDDLVSVSRILDQTNIVYLYTTPDVLAHRLAQRGDEYVVEDVLPVIMNKYDEWFEKLNLDPIRIDVTNMTPLQVVERCLKIIAKDKK